MNLFRILRAALIMLMLVSLSSFSYVGNAQQRKISEEPVRFIDSSTGKVIPEVLVIPRYSSFKGISTLLGEGPGHGKYSDYLEKPFVYRTGEPFKLKRPKSKGLLLGPFLFIGKGKSVYGTFIFAPGYRPEWHVALWSSGHARDLRLTPISTTASLQLLDKQLSPLEKGAAKIKDDCGFWGLPESCVLAVRFSDKDRNLVQLFLYQARQTIK